MNQLTTYDEAYAAQAKLWAEQEATNNTKSLGTMGGILTIGEEAMPGDQICAIILDSAKMNTLYRNKLEGLPYNKDDKSPPICYGFARGNDAMAPHISMAKHLEYFQPQHSDCTSCQWNQWGSALTGKGKMCDNRRRLTLVQAGIYTPKKGSNDFDLGIFNDPQHYRETDLVNITIPPASLEGWSKYVAQLSAAMHRPPFGVITRLWLARNPKGGHTVEFQTIEEVPDLIYPVVQARVQEAAALPFQGYSPPEAKPEATQSGGLKGSRRR